MPRTTDDMGVGMGVMGTSRGREAAGEHARPLRRLALATTAATLVLAGAVVSAGSSRADLSLSGVPRATCADGDLPETAEQGRVPAADHASGRALQGYRCNSVEIGHHGKRSMLGSGGYKVQRYTDATGRTCAYYDSALMAGLNLPGLLTGGAGLGVVVLDMTDPAKPVRTANLVTPAMLQPHESLLVNQERGLLAAVMGTLATAPGVLDVYDISRDCRKPRLRSTTLSGVMGHESGFSPDGRTFWTAGAAGFTLTAVDLTEPRRPRILHTKTGVVYHGLRLSDDGRTMYAANIGSPSVLTGGLLDGAGLDILDVSDIQDRRPRPAIRTLSRLAWEESSIPQVAEPFTQGARQYVLEVDEFSDLFGDFTRINSPRSPVGAARIIDVTDPRAPVVVSNLRLEVHDPLVRDDVMGDPGARLIVRSYTGHYCSVPTRDDPRIAGCSMIGSGLRLFDISDVTRPREVGYFNEPGPNGAAALSQPAWDVERAQVWYTDMDEGFFAVGLRGPAAALLR
ncbi:LVIVD repeat-containing protein [Nocardioides sp. BYT-33-1]|uniref:LVIVD repeat-containing protein n=1 Tax=Nocardioides sp. BYT-33-1 TaxID=3416952 RepID=UPI003F52B928